MPREWKSARLEGFEVELPSGNRARLRRTLDMVELIKKGLIPNPLNTHLQRMIKGEGPDPDISKKEDDELVGQMLEFIDNCCYKIFVEPKVVPCPDGENPASWQPEDFPETISIFDVSLEDRSFAYSFGQGGPMDLITFRKAQQDLGIVADERKVLLTTVETPGD